MSIKKCRSTSLAMSLSVLTAAMGMPSIGWSVDAPQNKATQATIDSNNAVLTQLPFSDKQDYTDAKRGFIAALPGPIKNSEGKTVWTLEPYNFLKEEKKPDTINPSLYRQGQLNLNSGLFKVSDRIYQLRGLDVSNMTIIEGDTGLIVIDTLLSMETAKAGMDLYYQHRPKKPVVAVIYTHSHTDHYGGVKGVVSEADVIAGKVRIIAPAGFMEETISENVFAGNAMSRRAMYQFGPMLPIGAQGQVDAGNGKNASTGTVSLIAPTDIIKKTGEQRTIDGVLIDFQMAPGTEAPAEMLMYFPQLKALCSSEDAVRTLHNIYTLRGAKVRDSNAWWKALNETLDLYGDKAEVLFATHNWPIWEKKNIQTFLKDQRDGYKYLHDQTLRLMNHGQTMVEVAENIKLPPGLANRWYQRGYYGTENHNVKGIYQFYLGWYSSNPAELNPLPPVESSKKYVDYMGGPDAVIAKARESYAKGEYRWVSEVMSKVVFAYPDNKEAVNLAADSLEQQGYQAEAGTWRNEFLMGAYELRNGRPKYSIETASPDTVRAMTGDMILDYMGIRTNGTKAIGKTIHINIDLANSKSKYAVTLENSALTYTEDRQLDNPDASVITDNITFANLVMGSTTIDKAISSGKFNITGSEAKVRELVDLLDTFDPVFPIVTP